MMNRIALLAAGLLTQAGPALAGEGFDAGACAFNGMPLFGAVKTVDSFPDIRVQVVTSFPDLNVELVESFPDACGRWKPVDSFADIKIQYVDSFPDLKIRFVSSFPGVP